MTSVEVTEGGLGSLTDAATVDPELSIEAKDSCKGNLKIILLNSNRYHIKSIYIQRHGPNHLLH